MSKFSEMITEMSEEIHKYIHKCIRSASFDISKSARVIDVLENNKYKVRLSDGTEKSVLSLSSDNFLINDVVLVLLSQNNAKKSYIVGKLGVQKIDTSSNGDMFKSVYDTNSNGIVDNAEKVNGHTVLTDVPLEAFFTDTTYSIATASKDGLLSHFDKSKIDNIANGAEANVNSDWNAIDGDAKILNKPDVFTPSAHIHAKSDIVDFPLLSVVATSGSYNDLEDIPLIPNKLSDLSEDETHRFVSDNEKSTWNKKQDKILGNVNEHYHLEDRDRSNHTGTQLSSTISDFAFTVRNTVLTGLSTATNAIILTTDNVLTALGKLQKQIIDHLNDTTKHITFSERALWNTVSNKESKFNKNTAFNKNFGTTAGTVCQGDDSRLSDSRSANDVSLWAKSSVKPVYTKAEVGLGNVDNTSDMEKPISVVQQIALDLKLNNFGDQTINGDITNNGFLKIKGTAADRHLITRGIGGCTADTLLEDDLYVNFGKSFGIRVGRNGQFHIDGNGTIISGSAVTQNSSDNSTKVATTAFVQNALSSGGYGDMLKSIYDPDNNGIVNNAKTLNGLTSTITELNYTDGVTSNIQTQLNAKASLDSPTFTGIPKAATAVSGTNTPQIATTAFVQSELSAVTSSPQFISGRVTVDGVLYQSHLEFVNGNPQLQFDVVH